MDGTSHPLHRPAPRPLTGAAFSREEVRLANRNAGILLEALHHDVTPAGLHYLLIHFDVPYVAPGRAPAWTLDFGAGFERPFAITQSEIAALPQKTLRVTLECAGNGRALLAERRQSQPWHSEAVGTSEWTGTPLRPLLERAGVPASTVDIVFLGRDRGFDDGVEHDYGRSLAPAMARDEDVLLVTAMNGQPLLPQHGFPLRLIVPGWYGMASVKWLDRIEAWNRPYDGFQQVRTYRYKTNEGDAGIPITTMRVKSLMAPPGIPDWYSRHRLVEAGATEIVGRAWSGAGVGIEKVEVAVDGVWSPATLDPPSGRYAWRGWRFHWSATPGEHQLMCRATDVNGDVQPIEPRFDRGGFGNNACQRVAVTVR
jgi:DMSO/TMAO reductase YedYZ molybdopterin-dependent catalytic subunit